MYLFKGVEVTAQAIENALRYFDSHYLETNDFNHWLENKAYKFAVVWNEILYPCKHILSEATSISVSEFHGGKETNDVFQEFGLQIIMKP